jgi:hypothetical protein
MPSTSDFIVILPDGRRFGPGSMEVLEQWAREGRIPNVAQIESADGLTPARPVLSEPRLAAIIAAPPTIAGQMTAPEDSGISSLIPYKNGHALAAYYIGIMSLLPVVGILLAPIAIFQGVRGIRDYREKPKIKGIVHAWIGVVLGSIGLLISGTLIAAMIIRLVFFP